MKENILIQSQKATNLEIKTVVKNQNQVPEILFLTSFPPRECGIATYSQDLIQVLNLKFNQAFKIKVCALESENEIHNYDKNVKYILNVDKSNDFQKLAKNINENETIHLLVIQHEFGFFAGKEKQFLNFLQMIEKPIALVFHTILPHPDSILLSNVQKIVSLVDSILVMTMNSKNILIADYQVNNEKISVIPHGTHLVSYLDKNKLKDKYHLQNKKVLSTFGLMSEGKNIETTLQALPEIIKKHPEVIFLIIGKTHPTIVKNEGQKYRKMLEQMIIKLQIQNHVQFINYYLPLNELLEYLQLTDIYLFTSKDRNQAVSGTFSYALSCGCSIISTPIPHVREVLNENSGIIIDFENPKQLSEATIKLLDDEDFRLNCSSNSLHKMAATSWENAAIQHAILFDQLDPEITMKYNLPTINLNHFKKMTTHFGFIQFAKINTPDLESGYTLDDNARALIAICQLYKFSQDEKLLDLIYIYFNFIEFCLQPDHNFLNYVDQNQQFTEQNYTTNLEDSNGRAIWALGYLIYNRSILPLELSEKADKIMHFALKNARNIHSPRSMSFIIKGLYYRNLRNKPGQDIDLIKELASRLVQMYRHEADKDWEWYESYLTYANSVLPEALLCAWIITGEPIYKKIAKASFDFLLSKTFSEKEINIISNKTWLHKINDKAPQETHGEQPIDVAYTILALNSFYDVFEDDSYLIKSRIAMNWFLGNNHLKQIVYNPCTGGCYDGLEDNNVNLNQGAESTISYLLARMNVL